MRSVWMALGAAIWMVACGPATEVAEHTEELASAKADLGGSTCRPTSEPSVGTGNSLKCTGPWEYRNLCPKHAPNPDCGAAIGYEQVACNATCNHPSGFQQLTFTGTASGSTLYTRTCDFSEKPPCSDTSETTWTKTCEQVANEILANRRAQGQEFSLNALVKVSETLTGSRTTGSSTVVWNSPELYITRTPFTQQCNVVIDNNPVAPWTTSQSAMCGQTTCNGAPIYPACRTGTNGYEDNPAVCDTVAGYGVKYSAPGTTLGSVSPNADLRVGSQYPNRANCMTADEIPFSSSSQKYTELLGEWNRATGTTPPPVDVPSQKRFLVDAFKTLFELQGRNLTSAQQTFILDLYNSYPDFNRLQRIDPVVDFEWGLGSPTNAIAPDTFSARWTGEVVAPATGSYVFQVVADDGIRLWVNNQLLVDQWIPQVPTAYTATISLTAGQHYPIRMEFFDQGNISVARLLWTPPGATTAVVIPSTQLHPPGSTANGLLGEYFDDVDFTSSDCNTWTPPVPEGTCSGAADVNAKLAMCHRMNLAHVSRETQALAWNRCMDVAASAAALTCGQPQYRNAWHDISRVFVTNDLASLARDAQGNLDRTDLQKKLGHLSQWYGLLRDNTYAGQPQSDALWKDLDGVFSDFWRSAYAGGLLSTNSTQLNAADPFNTGLATDRAILRAALTATDGSNTGPLPLTGAPLLMLLGDGLHGLHDRMEDFSMLHDLGCRYMACGGIPGVQTEVSELWSLFGASADSTALSSAVTSATLLGVAPTARADWREVFNLLQRRHSDLEAAVVQTFGVTTGYDKKLLLETPPASLPRPAVSLARFVRDGNTRISSYARSGTFLLDARNSLRVGIQETKRNQLDSLITTRTQNLTNDRNDYVANRDQYVQARLAEMGNADQRASIQAQLDAKLAQFNQLASDLTGLRANAALEDAAFGDFAVAFNTASEAEQADLAKLAITRNPVEQLSISAAEAYFESWMNPTSVGNYAVKKNGAAWSLSARAGDIINITARNQWAPTCALSRAQLNKPLSSGKVQPSAGVAGALTGSEGYLVTIQDNAFNADSNATSKYAGASASLRACAGARVESGGGWNFVVHAEAYVYAYAEACISGELGIRAQSDSSSGTEQRVSASYNTGIRLDGTPFPRLPAGSLLLVQVEHDTQAIRDIQVVQPSTTVVIGARAGAPATGPQVDLYLVANDVKASACVPDTAHSLSVDVQQLVPAGTVVQQVAPAMAKVLMDMRAATDALVSQGRILSQDMAARRQAAQSDLYEACRLQTGCAATGTCASTCNLTQFPPTLMALYDTFVAKELARMERKVEIRNVERQMELISLDMKALADTLENAEARGRVLRLVPVWSLRNLDGEKLRNSTRDLSVLVTDYLYPVMDLRYPAVMGALKTDPALLALIRADWTQPYVDLATLELNAVTRINTALGDGRFQDPDPNYALVALSFPRTAAARAASSWPKVSEERATAVWTTLMDATNPKAAFSVTLTPADVYAAIGAVGGALQCTDGTPILHRMGLFFVRSTSSTTDNTTLNNLQLLSSSTFEPELTFTGALGNKTYFVEDDKTQGPLWRVGKNRLLFGLTGDALNHFNNLELSRLENQQAAGGDGLSPFVTARFDVTGLRTNNYHPLDAASELVVVMQVDRRTVTAMPQPLVCQ
ncbi:PA14 domain-containing protein [Pyxidicoccus caerfyrddinensis]|uniref:PA14 domain-containing protein n=1 Tax=Pyxidicoccus caerfyrddinensis TaxID=2709663 RepID=UPI0013DC6AB4|nr:PA14 domain-containing protein [Pyxidicoccus caerfyrddinensis]